MKSLIGRTRIGMTWWLSLLFSLVITGVMQAEDFSYTTNSGKITIKKYNGSDGSLTIPNTINGLPVVSIGNSAFSKCIDLIGVAIPASVTNIGAEAFSFCTNLTKVYFKGNAPNADSSVFSGADKVTVYYLPGTEGWGATFAGRPTAVWVKVQTRVPPIDAQNRCINNLRQIEAAKEQWALATRKQQGDEVVGLEAMEYVKHPETVMNCPAGGTIFIGRIGEDASCTIPGHQLQ